MTRNQLTYWELKETTRSHKAQEKETNRSNLAREAETNRHNVATEVETNRHNVAVELLTKQQQQEQQRHNVANEVQARLNWSESREARQTQNDLALKQMELQKDIALAQIRNTSAQINEISRHNQSTEKANLLTVAESNRHNQATELISRNNLLEINRSNLANESLKGQQIAEQHFSNLNDSQRIAETARHNVRIESETSRSNRAREELERQGQVLSVVNAAISASSRAIPSIGKAVSTGGLQW